MVIFMWAIISNQLIAMDQSELSFEKKLDSLCFIARSIQKRKFKINNSSVELNIDKSQKTVKNLEKFTLFSNGLVTRPLSFGEISPDGKRYGRYKSEYENSYPGTFVIPSGAVNIDRDQSLFSIFGYKCGIRLARCIKPIFKAFNYKNEVKHIIPVLRLFNIYDCPVETWQTLYYGFQPIIYALHALTSDHQIACEVRKELSIDDKDAKQLVLNLKHIIVQAPLMKAEDMLKCGVKFTITRLNMVCDFILLGYFLCTLRKSTLSQKQLISYMVFFVINKWSFNRKIKQYAPELIVPLLMKIMTSIASMDTLGSDTTLLLNEMKNTEELKHITLVATYQNDDKVTGPFTAEYMQLLHDVFPKSYFAGSSDSNHVLEGAWQVYWLQRMRKLLHIAYYPNVIDKQNKNFIKFFNDIKFWCRSKDGINQFGILLFSKLIENCNISFSDLSSNNWLKIFCLQTMPELMGYK